ncbi:MAG: hypothetical protein AAGI01_00785 [Myxococcota bacterium]
MSNNRLKIQASSLKLEFTGEAENILQGYQMTRELLIELFQQQISASEEFAAAHEDEGVTELLHAPNEPRLLHRVSPEELERRRFKPKLGQGSTHLSISLSSELYHKVCVLERSEFERSPFYGVLDFDSIQRLYIQHSQADDFSKYFRIGKVLWRELTTQGREAVRKPKP